MDKKEDSEGEKWEQRSSPEMHRCGVGYGQQRFVANRQIQIMRDFWEGRETSCILYQINFII